MAIFFRSLAAACIGAMAAAGTVAQERGADAEPDAYTKMTAVQLYLQDGSVVIVARACNDSMPDFMSAFLPRFANWRAANAKQIALGATLSAQFKDAQGASMDPAAVGNAAAQQLRAMAPGAQREECDKLLQGVSP
jgi:hypothetical protein